MKIQYWDSTTKSAKLRDATPQEVAQFAEPSTPPALADAVPMLNLYLVLIEDGHMSSVQGALTSMQGDDGLRARAYWDKALTARRDNALVNELWPMLYEDEAAFNEAWARAAALNP